VKIKQTYKYDAQIESFYLVSKDEHCSMTDCYTDKELSQSKFEILSEEDKEIDIQAIEEINFLTGANDNELDIGNKINELIKAIKQLDKK
jgi:hypothetical protein